MEGEGWLLSEDELCVECKGGKGALVLEYGCVAGDTGRPAGSPSWDRILVLYAA